MIMPFSKESLYRNIDDNAQKIIENGRAFFNCPEPGFREFKTQEMICERLQKAGISFERDIALTGVRATIGHGSFHIAVTADIDALPRRDGNGYIHSCGHSIQTANALTLLDVLAPYAEDPSFDGRVSVFFTPAEEMTNPSYRKELIRDGKILAPSGKQHMIAAGMFDDTDLVLSCHASDDPPQTFNINSVLTGFLTKRAVFHGRAAHSGAAPHLGRNALSGAVLASQAISYLKDQFAQADGVLIHPVIGNVTGGINTIPDQAVLETYIRTLSNESLMDASEKFDRCVSGCANALGLTSEVTTSSGYLPLRQSHEVNQVIYKAMQDLVDERHILHDPISGASGDIGDLSALLPCIQFGFSGIKGAFHTDQFEVVDETFCYLTAAKVLAGTIQMLLTNPASRVKPIDFQNKKEIYLRSWLNIT